MPIIKTMHEVRSQGLEQRSLYSTFCGPINLSGICGILARLAINSELLGHNKGTLLQSMEFLISSSECRSFAVPHGHLLSRHAKPGRVWNLRSGYKTELSLHRTKLQCGEQEKGLWVCAIYISRQLLVCLIISATICAAKETRDHNGHS